MARVMTAVEFDLKDLYSMALEEAKRQAPKNVGGSEVEWLYKDRVTDAGTGQTIERELVGARVSFKGVGEARK